LIRNLSLSMLWWCGCLHLYFHQTCRDDAYSFETSLLALSFALIAASTITYSKLSSPTNRYALLNMHNERRICNTVTWRPTLKIQWWWRRYTERLPLTLAPARTLRLRSTADSPTQPL
jgi:hypothetical protein